MSESYKELSTRLAYEAGQKHGSQGKSAWSGGWHLNDDKFDAWNDGWVNGTNNQPKK